MRLVQYILRNEPNAVPQLGICVGQEVINMQTIREGVPNSLLEMLHTHSSFLSEVETMKMDKFKERLPLDSVQLLAPITGSDKLICVGMNYTDSCSELNYPVPAEPMLFSKFPSCLTGPFDPIHYPNLTSELDYEVELAFVIRKRGKDIPIENAMDYILGYTVAHDVSARDWQLKKNGGQWLIGKAMDDFCPIGPHIVTKSEIPDPHNLSIKFCTLLPGDIILTGTPPGIGIIQKPPFFLKKTDVVECEIENIGFIRNEIV